MLLATRIPDDVGHLLGLDLAQVRAHSQVNELADKLIDVRPMGEELFRKCLKLKWSAECMRTFYKYI